jgi:hypothetical protein
LRKKVGHTEIVSLGEVKASWKTERKHEQDVISFCIFQFFSSYFWCSCQVYYLALGYMFGLTCDGMKSNKIVWVKSSEMEY